MSTYYSIRARGPRQDLTGRRYGKLTVREWAGHSSWWCDCDCGGRSRVLTANLGRNTNSCGCVRNIKASMRATKHGLYHTRAYKTWTSIKKRCFDSKCRAYKDYGARGITMYEDWVSDPVAFVSHVGQPPSGNYTLDRIDNAKGYEPGNLRWATPTEQANNKTTNRIVTWRGQQYTLSQLARTIAAECGITHQQMLHAFERCLYQPQSQARATEIDEW